MARPRLIIIVRHGESAANCDRIVNASIPNHLVPLTANGREQAVNTGKEIAALIKPKERVLIYRSPYKRTRQTAEGIMSQLDLDSRWHFIIDEPRLREQDFGNFQDPKEIRDALSERSRYGTFFYRIPDGESAADVYDRCCHFNISLHRHFDQFEPDVVIMVSHGIWGRVFLMSWFHWGYEVFENLKNLHYCEPILMELQNDNKYKLLTSLATWDEPPSMREEPSPALLSQSEAIEELK